MWFCMGYQINKCELVNEEASLPFVDVSFTSFTNKKLSQAAIIPS